jgi:hypothetical protein
MKDYLQDIVAHTHALGVIDLVKITGDSGVTNIEAMTEDRSVIVQAKFNNPVPEFMGLFGMPNLGKLNTILNIPEYKEDAKISLTTQDDGTGKQIPSGLHFENKDGDFKNDYRFMVGKVISEKLRTVKMTKAVKWNVELEPTVASITRLKYQASANSEETVFTVKTDGNKLKFYFGDHSTHAGDFVFADGISGSLAKGQAWPVGAVIGILGLSGDKKMYFSDDSVLRITVNSGIATYDYLLPAQSK